MGYKHFPFLDLPGGKLVGAVGLFRVTAGFLIEDGRRHA
jgi:hypothetical protein